jgi:Tfp pilus assembly protein PilX
MHAIRSRRRTLPSHQRGVALFVALIGMVVLMLAGLAIIRSVDASAGVAGNVAFRQATIPAVNQAVEQAIEDLFHDKIVVITANDAAHRYYATLQAGEKANGSPAILSGNYTSMAAAYTAAGLPAPYVDATSGVEVRYVIERVCLPDVMAGGGGNSYQYCDLLPPKVSKAGTDNKPGIPVPPIPNFRITVRADLPNTNSMTMAQGFVR